MKDYSPDCRGNTAAGNFACEELQQKREILRDKLSQEKNVPVHKKMRSSFSLTKFTFII